MDNPAAFPAPAVPFPDLHRSNWAPSERGDAHVAERPAWLPARASIPAPAWLPAGDSVWPAASIDLTADPLDKSAPRAAAGWLAIRDRSSRSTQMYWALAWNVFSCFRLLPPQLPIITPWVSYSSDALQIVHPWLTPCSILSWRCARHHRLPLSKEPKYRCVFILFLLTAVVV